MKIELPHYPLSRSSGVDWIGDIPNVWNTLRLRFCVRILGGVGFPEKLQGATKGKYPFLKNSDINGHERVVSKAENYVDGELAVDQGWKPIPAHSLIMGKIGEALRKNHRVFAGVDCLIDNNLMALVADKRVFNSDFFYYVFTLVDMDWFTNPGTVPSVSTRRFLDFHLPVPNAEDQCAIVAFLDRETDKIDRLMRVRQKQLESLREQRIAVIHRSVTRGLDSTVKMKPSAVEWLGEIPQNWDFVRLGFVASVKARLGWRGLTASEYVDEGNIFLSTPDIKGLSIDFENANFITDERYFESPEIMLQVGDVLLVKDGATLGIVNIVRCLPNRATVNGSIAVVRVKKLLTPCYLFYFLKSQYFQSVIQQVKGGMGVPHLFQSDLVKFKVLVPEPDEQVKIVDHLDSETAKIDALHSKYSRELELLVEYRASLIFHAVTGKIDVRGLFAQSQCKEVDAV
jgi:type I restriction enzyme S subunit